MKQSATSQAERHASMESQRQAQPNALLRHQRQLRGWSLQHVADQLCKLCEEEDRIPGVTADMIGKGERGEKKPSPFYREKLCLLYSKSADKLGFIDTLNAPERDNTSASLPVGTRNGAALYPSVNTVSGSSLNAHTFDTLLDGEKEASEMLVANLLSLSSRQLATLTTLGWTPHDIMAAIDILLQGEAVMAKINRRQVLQLGAGLFLSGMALPIHEHPSAEERTHLSDTIGESIAASWSLFQSTHTAQVLAVGQAQLSLMQQAHHTLYPSVRPMHYSSVYRLIGGALHFQGRYDEARRAHEKSYIAALEGGDVWNMAQSLSWQADGFKAQTHYSSALETIEGAVRLLSQQNTQVAIRLLEQAMDELPPQWTLRHATTLMPLALAYARRQKRDASLAIAEKAIPVIKTINSPSLSKQFIGYMQKEFIGSFPDDPHIHTFVADTEQRLLPAKATATDNETF